MYYFEKTTDYTFEEAERLVTEELKKEGFGVLTQIDIQEKLKEKLDVDFRKYKILGACHPPSAHKALEAEDKIGVMLPCNVILQEVTGDKVQIAAVNPIESMKAVNNNKLMDIAGDISERLKKVIAAV